MATEKPLLDIKDLHVGFRIGDDYFDAVDGVDISLQKNEILAIVGNLVVVNQLWQRPLWACITL